MSTSTSQVGLNLSISPTSIARGVAAAFGLMGAFFGGHSILYPSSYVLQFGFPASTPTQQSADTNPFIPVAGGRALTSGITSLALLSLGYDRAVGVVFMCGGLMGLVDGLVLVRYRPEDSQAAWKKAGEHFATVGVAVAVGAWMFANCTN